MIQCSQDCGRYSGSRKYSNDPLFSICLKFVLYTESGRVQRCTNDHEVISYEKLCRRYRTVFSRIARLLQQRRKRKFLVFVLLLRNNQSSSFSRHIHFWMTMTQSVCFVPVSVPRIKPTTKRFSASHKMLQRLHAYHAVTRVPFICPNCVRKTKQ